MKVIKWAIVSCGLAAAAHAPPAHACDNEARHYAPGIGLILEINPETGERTELVSRTR